MGDVEKEIEKMKFHIRLIAEAIDSLVYPIPSLVIEMGWSEEDLDKAHDIFEEYDKKLEAGEKVDWHQFEMTLRKTFEIGYQRVKTIVLAFYRNQQWTQVCRGYAKAHETVEFHEITRSKEE